MPNNLVVFPIGGGGSGPTADIYGPTRIVSLIAGEGTDLTIAAAIAALPAEGGYIQIKPGTYPVAATMTMPNKSVVIRGSGDGTIIDLGANAISAFTVPTGLTAFRKYVFEDFSVIGTSVAAQRVITVSDTLARGIVSLIRLKIEGIIDAVRVTAGDSGFDHAVQISMEDVWMIPVAAGTSLLLFYNLAAFRMVEFRAVRVRFYDVSFGVLGGAMTNSAFGAVDGYFQDCIIHLASSDNYFGSLYMEDCTLYDVNGTYKIIASQGSATSQSRSTLINVYAEGHIDIAFTDTSAVLGGFYRGPRLSGGTDIHSFIGVEFRFNGTNFTFGCLNLVGGDTLAEGCYFDFDSAPAGSRYLEVGSGGISTVRGCNFRDLPATATCAVALISPSGFTSISDCMFDQPLCPPYREFTGGSPMEPVFYNNNFFTPATIAATIIATGSRVDGVQMGDARDTATSPVVPAIAYGMGRIVSITTEVANDAGGGLTILQSHVVLASVLNQSLLLGRTIRVKAWGRTLSNANVKTLTLDFGGQIVMTEALVVSVAGRWRIDCEVIKTGPSTQQIFAELLQSPTVAVKQTPTAGVQTDTAAITIRCTGASLGGGDIVQEGMIIETS